MTEANNNANSFNSESNFESFDTGNKDRETKIGKASEAANESSYQYKTSPLDNSLEEAASQNCYSNEIEQNQPDNQKMNWQKVAHKLREYNRKLLKKVFRLEQELADVDNKFTKYVEKSRSSDILVAQQEKEIRKYQEEVELFDSQKADILAIIEQKEIVINNLSKQYELSQQQTAQLERDCTLLQESYNNQAYELTTKDKEIKDLQNKLSQQQRSALQYKAELKRYQEQLAVPTPSIPPKKEPAIPKRSSYSNQRTIQPWSTSTVPETKIAIPKAKSPSIPAKRLNTSETIKTAAQIATWSASKVQEQKTSQSKSNQTSTPTQSSVKVKPKSLAAVDLPTFPRPM